MSRYRIQVAAINLLVEKEGILRKLGYTTSCALDADDSEVAEVEAIRRVLEDSEFREMIRNQAEDPPRVEVLKPLLSDRVKHVSELDVAPFIHAANLVMTDASSVATEFTLLDRPMVFLDVPELIERARAEGALVDLETWGRRGGVVVESADGVEDAVADSLDDPGRLSATRAAIAGNLFYNPGRATDAAMDWLAAEVL